MSSQFIVIEKSGGWNNAAIVKDHKGGVNRGNKVFTNTDDAYKEAEKYQDAIVIGDIEASDERVYTNKQIQEFRNKLFLGFDPSGDLVSEFDKHFDIRE